jgi:hypothetical protein
MGKQRTFLRKLLGSLGIMLLLWSSTADALALHRCAHHDALPSAQNADQADHHEHQGAPAPGEDEQSSHGCTCVGTCATTTVAVVPAVAAAVADVAGEDVRSRSVASEAVAPATPDFLLPFATAPPASL